MATTPDSTPLTTTSPLFKNVAGAVPSGSLFTFQDYVNEINKSPTLIQALNSYGSAGISLLLNADPSASSIQYDNRTRALTMTAGSLADPVSFTRDLAHEIVGHDATRDFINAALDPTNEMYAGAASPAAAQAMVVAACYTSENLGLIAEYRIGQEAGFDPSGWSNPGVLPATVANAIAQVTAALPTGTDSAEINLAAARFLVPAAISNDSGHAQQCANWAASIAPNIPLVPGPVSETIQDNDDGTVTTSILGSPQSGGTTLFSDGSSQGAFSTSSNQVSFSTTSDGNTTASASGAGAEVDLSGGSLSLADGTSVTLNGYNNKLQFGSNDSLIQNTGITNKLFADGPVNDTLSATGGNNTYLSGGFDNLALNSTGITANIAAVANASVSGTGAVDLNNGVPIPGMSGNSSAGVVNVADGSNLTLGGDGTAYAGYGTVTQTPGSTLDLIGNSESDNSSSSGDTTYFSGLGDIYQGAGGLVIPGQFSSISVLGQDSLDLDFPDLAITTDGSSFTSNTDDLTDLYLYGTGDSLGGTGSGDSFNIGGTYDSNSLDDSSVTYFGSTDGDTNTGIGSTSSVISDPDSSYTDPSFSAFDPIVLNLQGGPVATQNLTSSTAYFDMQDNGAQDHTGWGTAGEGYLVYDPQNKGTVTNEQSLISGFPALDALDSNHDGLINSQDAAWAALKVWTDAAGNGTFSAGSLQTLDQLGITSISLSANHLNENQNNNTILDDSTFTWNTGATGDIAGVDFNFHASSVGAAANDAVSTLSSKTAGIALTRQVHSLAH